MSGLLIAMASFVLMEAASYATHRWVMHGIGRSWHRSHHAPPEGRWERNDLFPGCFSVIGVLLFALGSLGASPLWWVGVGVSAYGMAYLFVHDVYVHRRLPIRVPPLRYLEWLRGSHRLHHETSGEPYGMLLPLVRAMVPARSSERSDRLDRGVRRHR